MKTSTSCALQRLKELHAAHNREKYPSLPEHARVRYRGNPNTTNGLTKMICDYINLTGHKADRINNQGQWQKGEEFIDVIGRTRLIKGKWTKGQSTKGISDIIARKKIHVNGRVLSQTVDIEVKNKDRQSALQKDYQASTEAAGGVYLIARVGFFDEFVRKWENI